MLETQGPDSSPSKVPHDNGGAAIGAPAGAAPAAGGAAKSGPTQYRTSIYTGPDPTLPSEFVAGIQALEKTMGMPIWLLVQNETDSPYGRLGREVFDGFFKARHELRKSGRVALLVDSGGGYALYAYKLAKVLRNHAGGFTAVVPQYAKSAATLLALGAESIILAQDAELGPLDAQHYDADREEQSSALNECQALERLHADALKAVDSTVWMLVIRTKKKAGTLLPIATSFVAEMMRPLLEKIDTVHFSQMQRILKEAEDYAVRLLQPRFSEAEAMAIAEHLVSKYPEHGFPIDAEEAASFGLVPIPPSAPEMAIMDTLMPYLNTVTAIGRLEEVPKP